MGVMEKSFDKIRKAAKRGDAEAQYRLGLMHSKGEGAPRDKEEAKRLLQEAADRGHSLAQDKIEDIEEAEKAIDAFWKSYHEHSRWFGSDDTPAKRHEIESSMVEEAQVVTGNLDDNAIYTYVHRKNETVGREEDVHIIKRWAGALAIKDETGKVVSWMPLPG